MSTLATRPLTAADAGFVDVGDQPVFAATVDTLRSGSGPMYANAAARAWCRRRDIAANLPGTLYSLFGMDTVMNLVRAVEHADAAEGTFSDGVSTIFVHAMKLMGSSGSLIAFTIGSSPGVDRGEQTAPNPVVAGVDSLTGLVGPEMLLDGLRSSLASARPTAVLHVDLDKFRRIVETLGREIGDLLLLQFVDRLHSAVAVGPVVARVGDDEFVVVVDSATRPRVDGLIARLMDSASQPYQLAGESAVVPVSVGVAWSDSGLGPRDAERLLREAETALSEAKRLGRGRACEFSRELHRRSAERVELETQLRAALTADDQLHLNYQPQIDLGTGRIMGVEALARWRRPDGSSVPPAAFVPIAEESGLIIDVGRWVIRTACAQLAEWRANVADPPAIVSVNLSPYQLRDPSLVEHVAAATSEAGVEPSALCFELTEADLETIADDVPVLDRLAELGCFIGVDGFGAVGSSLSVLRDLPIEIVKIDRRFVAGLGVSTADAAIVESVIDLAARLEIYAIAQGVERAEQATVLAKLGCPAAQGHLFARACDATTIAAAMRGFMRWAGAPPSGGARRRSTSRVTDLLG